MSVDELWEIHEEISKLLKVKMLAETKTLERRLITLRPAEVDRRSIRARWELQNDRVIARAQLQAKQGDDQIKMQVQNQKLIENREAHQEGSGAAKPEGRSGDPFASAAGQRRGAPVQPEGAAAGRDAMKAGDRVKLTDAAASRLMNAYYQRGVVDWRKRRGTLHHVKLNKVEAMVFWDGRSSMEVMPIKYLELEKIGEPAPYGGTDYIFAP
jgi:hypothetical protein